MAIRIASLAVLLTGILGGVALDRYLIGDIAVDLVHEEAGVRCEIKATQAGAEWVLSSMTVEPATPEPCDLRGERYDCASGDCTYVGDNCP